jgi:hypothetical protein
MGAEFERRGQSEYAFEAYRRAWEHLLSHQPQGARYHKGRELASMASARLNAGLVREGLRWSLFAFIEDCLSRSEDSQAIHDELHWPASQWLRRLGFSERQLQDISLSVRNDALQRNVQDPGWIFSSLGLDDILAGIPERAIQPTPRRLTVFVSSPGDLRPERRLVAEVCRDLRAVTSRDIKALLWEGAGYSDPESLPFPPAVTGSGAQAVIDDQIWNALGGYDIYVGFIWRRMGSPTGEWRSGTAAELHYALNGYRSGRPRKLLFYVKQLAAGQQREPGVDEFVDELRQLALIQRFRTRPELRRMLVEHLGAEVRR